MLLRSLPVIFAATTLCFAANDQTARGSSESIEIKARIYNGKDAVKGLLGSDLDGFIAVVELTVTPLTERPVRISKDEFALRSDKDGQKSQPFAPSQIAGKGALVVTNRGTGGAIMGEDRGPIWGGIGGGRPGRMGGQGGGVGNAAGASGTNDVKVDAGDKEKPTPLLDLLRQRELPEKEISEAVTGLLYFPLEGKHKTKDLELLYKGSGGKVMVRFQ